MILFAKLHGRLIKVSHAVAATALTLGVFAAAGEWFYRQVQGLNVIHGWLELVYALIGLGVAFCLPSAWYFRGEASGRNNLIGITAAFGLLVSLILGLLLLDFSAASSAYWVGWSLSTPVLALTIAMLLCCLSCYLAINYSGRTALQSADAGIDFDEDRLSSQNIRVTNHADSPDHSTLFPLLLIPVSLAMLVIAGPADEAWYSIAVQITWNLLSGTDFAAAIFLLSLFSLWCVLEPRLVQVAKLTHTGHHPITDGDIELSPWQGVASLLLVLSPVGSLVLFAGLVTGVESGRLWAAMLFAWAGLIVLMLVFRAREEKSAQTSGVTMVSRIVRVVVPAALVVVVLLVLRGLGRPVEMAAVALLMSVLCLLVMQGPRLTWQRLESASAFAYALLGRFALWVIAAVLFYSACGLTGLQAFLAQQLLDFGASITALALAIACLILVLARWLAPAPLLVLALALTLPLLSFAGFSSVGLAVFFPLTVALGWQLRASLQSLQWQAWLIVAWLLSILMALIIWPDTALRFARSIAFW